MSNINKIQILSLKTNLGSQKAISIGLQYLSKMKKEATITVLDSDGEDDCRKIPLMIKMAEKNENKIIVSSRTKRHENFIFKALYFFHKLITFIFTFNWISFGSYSSFKSKNLNKILKDNSSWLALSAAISKNCKVIRLYAERKKRFFGESRLSFVGLINHSLRVNAVFMKKIIFISILYLIFLSNFTFLNIIFNYFLMTSIIIFNLTLFITLFLNKPNDYSISMKFIKNINKYP